MDLTKGHIYYSEYDAHGMNKPLLRGYFHLIALFTLMPYYYMNMESHFQYCLLGHILCFAISASYHIIKFKKESERFARMLDLMFIFVNIYLEYLTFSKSSWYYIIPFIFMCTCLYNMYYYAYHKPINYVIMVSLIQPDMPWTLTMLINYIIMGLGFYIMHNKLVIHHIFGYHEILHVATLISSYLLFLEHFN